jgi:hypothetical protein
MLRDETGAGGGTAPVWTITDVVRLRLPLVATTSIAWTRAGTVRSAATVNPVWAEPPLARVTGFGPKPHVTPGGAAQESVTAPEKPLREATVRRSSRTLRLR